MTCGVTGAHVYYWVSKVVLIVEQVEQRVCQGLTQGMHSISGIMHLHVIPTDVKFYMGFSSIFAAATNRQATN